MDLLDTLLPMLTKRAPALMRQYLPPGASDTWLDTWTRRAVAACLTVPTSRPPTASGGAEARTPIPAPIASVLTTCLAQASDQQLDQLTREIVALAVTLDVARRRDANAAQGEGPWPDEPEPSLEVMTR